MKYFLKELNPQLFWVGIENLDFIGGMELIQAKLTYVLQKFGILLLINTRRSIKQFDQTNILQEIGDH